MSDGDWHFAAKAADVEEDAATLVEIGERQIALCKVGADFHAVDNICSHEFACFTDGIVDGDEIECPLHQARFHIPTGKVLLEPATEDIDTFPVERRGDDIYVKV